MKLIRRKAEKVTIKSICVNCERQWELEAKDIKRDRYYYYICPKCQEKNYVDELFMPIPFRMRLLEEHSDAD